MHQQQENLILLIDLNTFHWTQHHYNWKRRGREGSSSSKHLLSFEDIVEVFNYMMASHIGKNNNNKISVYAFDENNTKKVFPVNEYDEACLKMLNFVDMRKRVSNALVEELTSKEFSYIPHSQLIKALSKSICTLNKIKLKAPKNWKTSSRIVLLLNSQVENSIFSRLMNCVFVLESKEIILDVLVLSEVGQDYLLQASQKTRGVYLPLKNPTRGAIQHILHAFVVGRAQRNSFKMPYLTKTNFSGSCSCHNEKTDLAWICSVCLAIYCQRGKERIAGVCRFCGEKYDVCDFNQKLIAN